MKFRNSIKLELLHMKKERGGNSRKHSYNRLQVIALFVFMLLVASFTKSIAQTNTTTGLVKIDAVYFAQTHLSKPDAEYFTLVGNRRTLIKAHIIGDTTVASPEVKAIVRLAGNEHEIILNGPDTLPAGFEPDIYKIQHSYEDGSFTGSIPKEWLKDGMTVEVVADTVHQAFDSLAIGAPTVLNMNFFKFACIYEEYKEQNKSNWKEEFQARLPVSNLDTTIIKAFFPEFSAEPRSDKPARRYNAEDWAAGDKYTKGYRFGIQCASALLIAAGTEGMDDGGHFLSYATYYTLKSGLAVGGSWKATGAMGATGFLFHECGHALGLPHCNQDNKFPYKEGTYGGIVQEKEWVGPNWGFCEWNEKFMSPQFLKEDSTWKMKKSPMLGGGLGDNEEWTNLKYFSDYEVWKMKRNLERHIVEWDSTEGKWGSWDDSTKAYTSYRENDGIKYSVGGGCDVYSVIFAISPPTPEANLVYPPIGPYPSGVIRLFDPNLAQDRADIQTAYSEHVGGFDYTLKIQQGNKEIYTMLPFEYNPDMDPLDKKSHTTYAINLKASDGEVTNVELLLTPDAELNGLPSEETIITGWPNTAVLVNDINSEPRFRAYPNPVSSSLTIENAPINADFSLINMAGQLFRSGTIEGTNMNLDVKSCPSGIYLLTVGDRRKKIIIE